MKILLIDVDKICDSHLTIPNLALCQASAWHKQGGDDITLIKDGIPEISDYHTYSWAYISCIFEKNKNIAQEIARMLHSKNIRTTIGGTGFCLDYDWLPSPIQKIKPDYDLYPSTYSQGYTTRGCCNNCGFCKIPQKEGKIQIWQHPSEFHDDRFDTMMIMDNNLFAAPMEWQDSVFNWFTDNKIKMLSPQGWDARLLNDKRAEQLKAVRHVDSHIHFAWDNMGDEDFVIRAIEILKNHGFNLRRNISFYVLCGYNTTFEQDLYRCQKLKDLGVRAYAMRYNYLRTPKLNALARWTAQPKLFWKVDFKDYTRKKSDCI